MTFPIIERNNNPMLDAPTQALLNIFLMEAYSQWERSYWLIINTSPSMREHITRLPTSTRQGSWSSTNIILGHFTSHNEATSYLTDYLRPQIPAALMRFIDFNHFQMIIEGSYYISITPKTAITEQLTPSHLDSITKRGLVKATPNGDYAVINVNGSRNKYFYSTDTSGKLQHYFTDSMFQETPAPARVQQAPRSSEARTTPSAARTVPIQEAAPSLADTAIFSSITDALMLGIGLLYLAISSSLNVFIDAVIVAVDLLYLAVGSSIERLERATSIHTRPLITDAITHSSETVSVEGDRIAVRSRSSQRNTGISLSSRYRALLGIIRANRIAMEQSFSNIGTSSSDTQAAALEQPRIEATQTVVDVVVPDLSAFTEAPAGSPSELVLEVNAEVAPTPELVQALVQEASVLVENTSVRVEPTVLDLTLLTETLNDNDAFAAPISVVSDDSFENVVRDDILEESSGVDVISSGSSMIVVDAPSPAPAVAANKTFTHTTANTDVALWDTAALLSNVRTMGKKLSTFEELHLDGEEFTDAPDKVARTSEQPAVVPRITAPAPKERPAVELEMG